MENIANMANIFSDLDFLQNEIDSINTTKTSHSSTKNKITTIDDIIDDKSPININNLKTSNRIGDKELIINNRWTNKSDKNKSKYVFKNIESPSFNSNTSSTFSSPSNFNSNTSSNTSSTFSSPSNFNSNTSLPISSNTNFNSPSKQNSFIKNNYEIRDWACSNLNLVKMIQEYEKNKLRWENSSISSYSIKNIIVNLTKYCRYDMLEYLRINSPIYLDKSFYSKDFYPFHDLVWLNFHMTEKKIFIEKNASNIKLKLNDKYIFDYKEITSKDNVTIREHFLDSLMHQFNKLDKSNKKELYNYFLKEWDNFHLIEYLVKKILSSPDTNTNYIDLIYFIKKYNEIGLEKIILLLCESVDSDNINLKNSNTIYDIIFGLCSEHEKNIYSDYLEINNYFMFKKDIVNKILKNYDKWIIKKSYSNYLNFLKIDKVDKVDKVENTNISTTVNKYYRNIMRILGCFYQIGINKEKIIFNIKNKISSKVEDIQISLLFFISNSNINLDCKEEYEQNFIKKYLLEYYLNSKIEHIVYIIKTFVDISNLITQNNTMSIEHSIINKIDDIIN